MPYTSITEHEINQMLNIIKANDIESLFNIVPKEYLIDYKSFNIPSSLSESEVVNKLEKIGSLNTASNNSNFIGGGAYDHYIPKIVDFLSSRSEFYTAYTPYQPEVSQGTLQYLYEFQSMICNLSGMDIANASLYDGGSAVAEACNLAISFTKKRKILLSKSLNPNYAKVVESYFSFNNTCIEYLDSKNGKTNIENLDKYINNEIACIVIQSPNYNGLLEDWKNFTSYKEKFPNLLIIAVSDPISLSIIKSPGELGCDIYVGEGQSLGNHLSYGGPYVGLFAAKQKYARNMPGRIIGRTNDVDGNEGFVMTLQTREQHIRRERATSNICTNQGLIALRATIYLSLLGKIGLPALADICFNNAQYAFNKICSLNNYNFIYDSNQFVKEFVVQTKHQVDKLIISAEKNGFNISSPVNDSSNSLLLLAFTEKYSKSDIDKLISFLDNYK